MSDPSGYPVIREEVPTFYFIGVTTGRSSINRVFPLWTAELGHPEVVFEGIDCTIGHAAFDASCQRALTKFAKYVMVGKIA